MNFDFRNGVAVLERTPRVLDALLSGLPEGWTTGELRALNLTAAQLQLTGEHPALGTVTPEQPT